MKRIQLCLRCGRPVSRAGYCDDCATLRNLLFDFDQKCTFCGKTILEYRLYFNKKTRNTYCENCKAVFVAQLLHKGIPRDHVNEVLKRDFVLISSNRPINL